MHGKSIGPGHVLQGARMLGACAVPISRSQMGVYQHFRSQCMGWLCSSDKHVYMAACRFKAYVPKFLFTWLVIL